MIICCKFSASILDFAHDGNQQRLANDFIPEVVLNCRRRTSVEPPYLIRFSVDFNSLSRRAPSAIVAFVTFLSMINSDESHTNLEGRVSQW